ncbi:MAG: LysE family transporter [Bacteroidota bacterium]
MSIFLVALAVSFVGSIPPGSINITTLQYALNGKKWSALTFAFAAAFVEFFYAGIAVKFQIYLIENKHINYWFKLLTTIVLVVLGILNLTKKNKEESTPGTIEGEKRTAFAKGIVLSVTNTLAIPFWLVVTSYLSTVGWVTLNGQNYLVYITGVSGGTFLLLLLVTYLGTRFDHLRHNRWLMYKLPGIIFIMMGFWTYLRT